MKRSLTKALAVFPLVAALIFLQSCSKKEEEVTMPEPTEPPKELTQHEKQIVEILKRFPDAQSTASGLHYVVEQEGEGDYTPREGTNVQAHYTGTLFDGGKKFDSSVDRGTPFQFPVGMGRVIKGWDEAFLAMKKGEKRKIILPSDLGYGARGAGGDIPANAILIFDVELLDFEVPFGLMAIMETTMGTITFKLDEKNTPKTVENFVGLATGEKEWKDLATGELVKKPFYDGLIFHRVITDFMIQGGCPQGTGTGGPGYSFEDECFTEMPFSGNINSDEGLQAVWTDIIVKNVQQNGGKSPSEKIQSIFEQVQKTRSPEALVDQNVEELLKEAGMEGPFFAKKLINSVDYGSLAMANSGPNTNGSQFFIVTNQRGTPHLNGKHTVFGKVLSGMKVALAIQAVEKNSSDRPLEDVKIVSIKVERGEFPTEG